MQLSSLFNAVFLVPLNWLKNVPHCFNQSASIQLNISRKRSLIEQQINKHVKQLTLTMIMVFVCFCCENNSTYTHVCFYRARNKFSESPLSPSFIPTTMLDHTVIKVQQHKRLMQAAVVMHQSLQFV